MQLLNQVLSNGNRRKSVCRFLGMGLVAALNLGIIRDAHAVVVTPNTASATPTGTDTLTGEIFVTSDSSNYTATENLGGGLTVNYDFTLTTKVYSRPADSNELDFVYQLTNTASSDSDSFERITVSNFSGFTTDADYVAGTGLSNYTVGTSLINLAPVSVDDVQSDGSVIGFQFGQIATETVNGMEETDQLVVRTNATAYGMGTGTVIDGQSQPVPINAPFAVGSNQMPEPGTLGLLSIISVGSLVRRRRAAN